MGHECILASAETCLKPIDGLKVDGGGFPCDVRSARGVDDDAISSVKTAAAQKCRVNNVGAGRVHDGHERVDAASIVGLKRIAGGKIWRISAAGHVRAAGPVHGDRRAPVG